MIRRQAPVFFSGVMALAVVGYFVGIGDGVPQADSSEQPPWVAVVDGEEVEANPKLLPAVDYADIADVAMGPTKSWQATPQALPQPEYELYRKIAPNAEAKEESGVLRASRRAFNGAPPVISHPVENTTDAACYACHGSGVEIAGLRASVMSHPFLGNCLQCHAPMAPAPFRDIDASVDSHFVGLPAPRAGQRAYEGAPPTIPHSQWMRENCHACHGGPHGWAGMETTHPWRTNCTQCHAPSATLDQMPEAQAVPMLPPLDILAN